MGQNAVYGTSAYLAQLTKRRNMLFYMGNLVGRAGLEPATNWLKAKFVKLLQAFIHKAFVAPNRPIAFYSTRRNMLRFKRQEAIYGTGN